MTLPNPDRTHVTRDGGSDTLLIPDGVSGEIIVTDLATLTTVPSSAYVALAGKVVRNSGVWAAGTGRWMVEFDLAGSGGPEPPLDTYPGVVEDDELVAKMTTVAQGDNAFTAVQRAAFEPATRPGLADFRKRLSNRNAAPVDLLAVGSSSTEGQNASTLGNRWVDLLLANLRRRYQPAGITGGVGYLPAYYQVPNLTDPFTLSGSALIQGTNGLGRRCVRLGTAAGTMTSISVQATRIGIVYMKSSGSGSFTYSVDGAAATTVSATNASFVRGNIVWIDLAAGAHTVTIAWASGGQVYIEGMFVCNGDETKGVRLWEGGKGGTTSAEFSANTDWLGAVKTINPALAMLMLGPNDYSTGVLPATVKANAGTIIDNLRAQNPTTPPSILVIAQWRRADVTAPAAPWSEYVTALRDVAAEKGAAFLDLYAQMGDAEAASGYYNVDLIHTENLGQQLVADKVDRFLVAA